MSVTFKVKEKISLVYVLLHATAHFSARYFEVMPGISIWYAPAGLAMGLFLLLGLRALPVVLCANLFTAYLGNGLADWWSPILYPALLSLNYAFFAFLARKATNSLVFPDSPRRLTLFILVLVAAPASVAVLGTGLSVLLRPNAALEFLPAVLQWWLGDFCGLLTVVPAALVFGVPLLKPNIFIPGQHRPCTVCWLRILIHGLLTLSTLGLVFVSDTLRAYHAFYICFVPLVVICLEHGLQGASLSIPVIMLGGLLGIHHYGDGSLPLIANFLLFMVAVAGVGLGLGSAISSRNQMQQRFLKSQKLESLGVLAGGIAHDFNNLLTVILGNATLARVDTGGNRELELSLDQIETASRKAAELCQQMLVYAGKAPLNVSTIDLQQLASSCLPMISGTLPKGCRLILQPSVSPPLIRADESQLRQILLTLAINAAEALTTDQGRILIRCETRRLFRDELRHHYAPQPFDDGDYAVLEVEDNGCGMPPEVLARIFEPFYSTKFVGKGMGLAAVLGMVKANQGAVGVSSTPGGGTRFQLVFPQSPAELQPKPAQGVAAIQGLPPAGGRVLLVDDDDAVRALLRRCLVNLGFSVTEAVDGLEAVERFERRDETPCCVIMDIVMPRMDGISALVQMRRINAQVPVILISGYQQEEKSNELKTAQAAAFLTKPFEISHLQQHLASLLNRRVQT